MWSWFGGGSAQARKDSPKNAILNLRSQLDMLQKRNKHLQSQIDEQHEIARKNATTNKNGKHHGVPVAHDNSVACSGSLVRGIFSK